MTSKQKRKRFENKRKRKEHRKRQKQSAMKLAYSEYLTPFEEVIYKQYKPDDISLYRWVHNPMVEDDFKPQIFQSVSSKSVDELEVPDVSAPDGVILEYISWFTLSHFSTLEQAINMWQSSLRKILKKYNNPDKKQKELQKWINKKGQFVVKIDYTSESGLIGPQSDGIHKELFPFEGVDVEALVDKTFEPVKIEII